MQELRPLERQERALELLLLALVQVLAQAQVQVQVQVRVREQWHRRNQPLRSPGSSCHHASIGRNCSSTRRRPNCASYEFLVRQPRMQMLLPPGMLRSY